MPGSGTGVVIVKDRYHANSGALGHYPFSSGGGAGTVVKTPVGFLGSSTAYGWVTDVDGITTRVAFTGSNFTLPGGSLNDVVCVWVIIRLDTLLVLSDKHLSDFSHPLVVSVMLTNRHNVSDKLLSDLAHLLNTGKPLR